MGNIEHSKRELTPEDFGIDTSGHDTACDCKGCLLDEWHAEVESLHHQLKGAVAVADVEQLLADTSRYFAGDHVNAGVVVGEMRKRLRALAGGQ